MTPAANEMSPAQRWLIAATVLQGTFMAVMDVSVVNVSLPHMMGTFSVDLSAITWVATAYAIAQIVMMTMAGWLSTLLGRKKLYIGSLLVFIVGSILAGTARTFPEMVIYRVLQGLGGGVLIPVALSILRESFPPRQQGMAMAIYGMGVVVAPAVGPVLGGWLTDTLGWPWIFYINVPISIPAMLMAAAFVKDPPYLRRGISRIDWFGIVLLGIGLTAMQIVLERGQEKNWFSSNFIIIGTVIGGVALAALVLWELHVDEPVIDLGLFRNVALAAGSTVGLIFGVALFGTTFILPQFTQRLLGYPAFQSGMVLLPRAMSLFVLMPVAGALLRRLDARLLLLFGISILGFSYYLLAQLALTASYWSFVPLLLLLGCGMPFLFVTLTTVSLSTVKPEDSTHASSLYTLTRTVGGNIGYALMATLVADYSQVNRSQLVAHITPVNPLFRSMYAGAAQGLMHFGYTAPDASVRAYAIVDGMVNQQAAMMAYNSASWWMMVLVLASLPLVFILPGKADHGHGQAPSEG